MELAVIFFLTVAGLGNEINKTNDRVDALETQVQLQDKWIQDLENWNAEQDEEAQIHYMMSLKLAAAHSAFYAGQQLENDKINMQIEQILKDLQSQQ